MRKIERPILSFAFAVTLGAGLAGRAGTLPADFSPETFFQKTALEQQAIIWQEVQETAYAVMPTPEQVPAIDLESLADPGKVIAVFQYESVLLPQGTVPGIHQLGTVAKVALEMQETGQGYTGIFRTGGPAILRLSLGKSNPAAYGSLAFMPGLSLKLLRDHHPDSNIMAMHSIEGQGGNANFFAHTFSNFPGPAVSLSTRFLQSHGFENALAEFTHDRRNLHERAQVIPLAEASRIEADGTAVARPHAPYEIVFQPNTRFHDYFQEQIDAVPKDQDPIKVCDFRKLLADPAFSDGETLFYIYARDREVARELWNQNWSGGWSQLSAWWKGAGYVLQESLCEAPPQSTLIGRLVLKSGFIASRIGDQLAFRQPTAQEQEP